MDLNQSESSSTPTPKGGREALPWDTDAAPRAHRALSEQVGRDAADLFESAWRVWNSEIIPSRLAMSSVAMRELMDVMERAAGFKNRPIQWRDKIVELSKLQVPATRPVVIGLDEAPPGGDQTEFELALTELIHEAHNAPSRRDIGGLALEELDPFPGTMAPVVRVGRAKTWAGFRLYFNSVLHHNVQSTESELKSNIDRFTGFVCDLLLPRTYADLDNVDALLANGPPDE